MSEGSPTVTEAIAGYVAGLPAEMRAGQQLELGRFVLWFGPGRGVEQITGIILETYQQQLERSGADLVKRLEPLKSFVTYLQKKGYLSDSIAKLIKFKRVAGKTEKGIRASRIENREAEDVQLTREGFERAKGELDHLINEVRPLVAHELKEARVDKDFRENAPYDAAKQHQAHVESRIRDLERILATATIIEDIRPEGKVTIGSTVVLLDIDYDERVKYTIVGSSEADPKVGKISTASPVGKALLDRTPGETIEVSAPVGIVQYRIEHIEN